METINNFKLNLFQINRSSFKGAEWRVWTFYKIFWLWRQNWFLSSDKNTFFLIQWTTIHRARVGVNSIKLKFLVNSTFSCLWRMFAWWGIIHKWRHASKAEDVLIFVMLCEMKNYVKLSSKRDRKEGVKKLQIFVTSLK